MAEIAIIHLSDLHYSHPLESNWWAAHKEQFLDALCRMCAGCTSAIIVFSGDLSQSGQSQEYSLIIDLLIDIGNSLDERCNIKDVPILTVPGNHDCDLSGDQSTRTVLLSAPADKLSSAVISQICEVQANYFETAKVLHPETAISNTRKYPELLDVKTVTVENTVITFNLLNSAWTSTIKETYGALRLPADITLHHDGDIVISVIHHPISWLRPENGIDIRTLLETSSDFVITGHIHTPQHGRHDQAGPSQHYSIESGPLQDRERFGYSEFGVLRCDTKLGVQKHLRAKLHGVSYSIASEDSRRIVRNCSTTRAAFEPTPEFREWLESPGAGIVHKSERDLRLSDFFVMPSLLQRSPGSKQSQQVKPAVVLQSMIGAQNMILAPEGAGRSALLRVLANQLNRRGIAACVIQSSELKGTSLKNPERIIADACNWCYGRSGWESLKILPRDRRAILLDDVHILLRNCKDISAFLSWIHATFATVITTANMDFAITEMVEGERTSGLVAEYEHFQLAELGHRQRAELVRKWMLLDKDIWGIGRKEDTEQQIAVMTNRIGDLVSRGGVQSFASTIVLLLQSADSQRPLDASIGLYGHLYHSIINKQLLSGSAEVDSNTKASFLTQLAGYFGATGNRSMTSGELDTWFKEYDTRYDVGLPWNVLRESVIATKLLKVSGDVIAFRFPLAYCYFYASYLAKSISAEGFRVAIDKLVESIHLDESAVTIMCLIGITNNDYIIEAVLRRAKKVFAEQKPIDLVEDTKAVNDLIAQLPTLKLRLADPHPTAASEMSDSHADLDAESIEKEDDREGESVADIMVEFSAGYRIVQVIGQILRGFAGSILADRKKDLCRECFDVGLRTLNYYVDLVCKDQHDAIKQLAARIKEFNPKLGDDELYHEVGKRVFFLTEHLTVNVLRHVSLAVGSRRIDPTLQKCLNQESSSDKLIELVIRLDHYKDFPRSIVEEYEKGKGSRLALAVVRDLVWLHLHVVERPRELREAICRLLDIELVPRLVYNKDIKRLPGKAGT